MLFKSVFTALLFTSLSGYAEELSGPPAIFVPEGGQVFENDALPFDPLSDLSDVSGTESVSASEIVRKELLAEKPFKASFNMVNRRTNVISTLKFTRTEAVQEFSDMKMTVHHCLATINDVYDNDGAFVEITDKDDTALFSGWVYKKRPAMHAFAHPVYSMSFLGCK